MIKYITLIIILLSSFSLWSQSETVGEDLPKCQSCKYGDLSHCKNFHKNTDEFLYFVDYYSAESGNITTSFKDFLNDCIATGRSGYVHQGNFLVDQTCEFVDAKVDLEFDLNCTIMSSANIGGPILQFRNSEVRIEGGIFDATQSPFILNQQGPTCLSFIGCEYVDVIETKFFGIRASRPTDPGQFGDSGITAIDCININIENCTFTGMPDLGVYISGNNNAGNNDNGGDVSITQSSFNNCSSAVSLKRQATGATVSDNRVYDSFVGMSCYPAGGNDIAGDRTIFSLNHYIRCERGLEVRGGIGFVNISVNYFEDNSEMAVRLLGASNCLVGLNIMNGGGDGLNINDSPQYGIPSNNQISNNIIMGYTNAIRELAGSGVNYYSYNQYGGGAVSILPTSIEVTF